MATKKASPVKKAVPKKPVSPAKKKVEPKKPAPKKSTKAKPKEKSEVKHGIQRVKDFPTKNGVRYGCSIGQDKNGFFAYTHRARSKSYENQLDIPVKDLKFIESTG